MLFDHVLLLSTGRIAYSGPTAQIGTYFADADFVCPEYKSAADYYLDLVTVDMLSTDAMAESAVRIEALVQMHAKRAPILQPMSPIALPPQTGQKSFLVSFLSLWM